MRMITIRKKNEYKCFRIITYIKKQHYFDTKLLFILSKRIKFANVTRQNVSFINKKVTKWQILSISPKCMEQEMIIYMSILLLI